MADHSDIPNILENIHDALTDHAIAMNANTTRIVAALKTVAVVCGDSDPNHVESVFDTFLKIGP